MIEISLREVGKTYNPGLFKKKVRAVTDLSLEVGKGEVFGLIGPNGAGKSTTIRMILGLIRPDSGAILFRERPLQESGFRREIGYLPENPHLYDHLSLHEMLAFCGKVSGLSRAETAKRAEELTGRMNLAEARKRPLRTYSKGMLQRAGICFALLHDPSVLILDEPMSGLDPIGRKMVFDLVMELKEQGKTLFFCSHILSDVERLCDRIGLMDRGRLVKTFAREEFWHEAEDIVHLYVGPLTEAQQEKVGGLVESIDDERDGQVVSVRPEKLSCVAEALAGMQVPIRGSRSERVSLEELFMQVVEGGNQ